jgi:hypothetical protein
MSQLPSGPAAINKISAQKYFTVGIKYTKSTVHHGKDSIEI